MNDSIPVFDLHSDIPADIARRRALGERAVFKTHHFQRLIAGGIQAAILVLWVEPEYRNNSAQRLIELLGSLLADLYESADCVQLVTNRQTLEDCISTGKFAVLLGVEGMTFVEQWPLASTPEITPIRKQDGLFEKFHQSFSILKQVPLRHAIFAWGEQNEIASGPGVFFNASGRCGLSDFGRYIVKEFEQSNVIIDISHLDDRSIEDVLNTAKGIVVASHSNARALCEHPRNLTDDQLREIGRRDGVVGINAYAKFIHANEANVDRYIDHIVYIANLIGIDHVAFGFDFMDYLPDSFGFSEVTRGLTSAEDVPELIERLYKRGFTNKEVKQLAFQNALRIIG